MATTDTPSQIVQYKKDTSDQDNGNKFVVMPDLPDSAIPRKLVASPEDAVLCNATNNKLYRYNEFTSAWHEITGALVADIAMGHNDLIYVVTTNGHLYYYIGENEYMEVNTQRTYAHVGVSAQDVLMTIGTDGYLYRMFDQAGATESVATSTSYQFRDISVASPKKIMAITTDNKIMAYVGEGVFSEISKKQGYFNTTSEEWGWTTVNGTVLSMDHDSQGTCYIISQFDDGGYGTFIRVDTDEFPPAPTTTDEETDTTTETSTVADDDLVSV